MGRELSECCYVLVEILPFGFWSEQVDRVYPSCAVQRLVSKLCTLTLVSRDLIYTFLEDSFEFDIRGSLHEKIKFFI